MNERDLLVVFKSARQELNAVKEHLKEVQKRYDEAETMMVEHLIANQAEATASYDGIGYAQLMKPRIYASCLKENEEKLKEYLRDHGRQDLIRESIAAPSLSAYVGELVESGKAIPPLISYYLKQGVKLY